MLHRLVWSSDVVFNEDTISTEKVQSKSRKQVSFDLMLVNPEDHADESRESTNSEDYEEATNSCANLP